MMSAPDDRAVKVAATARGAERTQPARCASSWLSRSLDGPPRCVKGDQRGSGPPIALRDSPGRNLAPVKGRRAEACRSVPLTGAVTRRASSTTPPTSEASPVAYRPQLEPLRAQRDRHRPTHLREGRSRFGCAAQALPLPPDIRVGPEGPRLRTLPAPPRHFSSGCTHHRMGTSATPLSVGAWTTGAPIC